MLPPISSPLSSISPQASLSPPAGLSPPGLDTAESKLPFELRQPSAENAEGNEPIREAFGDFVGQTLFGSMMSSMRKSLDKPAYFHGGRAEEVFQQQLDQTLVEEISDASADSFVNPMFDLFQLQRRG